MAQPKDEELGEDFSYILRMADTDMDGLKTLATALTAVKGIGARTAIQICKEYRIRCIFISRTPFGG